MRVASYGVLGWHRSAHLGRFQSMHSLPVGCQRCECSRSWLQISSQSAHIHDCISPSWLRCSGHELVRLRSIGQASLFCRVVLQRFTPSPASRVVKVVGAHAHLARDREHLARLPGFASCQVCCLIDACCMPRLQLAERCMGLDDAITSQSPGSSPSRVAVAVGGGRGGGGPCVGPAA